jgi:uncharacterized membrane protein
MTETPTDRILPAHVEGTVEAIATLHAEHYDGSTPLQKAIDRATSKAGRPGFVALLTVVVVGWMAVNLFMIALGLTPLDEPPFFWMQGAVALTALYMTLLILATQRREDQLASRREQPTLELSILAEQKSAKIIELMEELRRDLPMLQNRVDQEASDMSVPVDPKAVFKAIADKHEAQISP